MRVVVIDRRGGSELGRGRRAGEAVVVDRPGHERSPFVAAEAQRVGQLVDGGGEEVLFAGSRGRVLVVGPVRATVAVERDRAAPSREAASFTTGFDVVREVIGDLVDLVDLSPGKETADYLDTILSRITLPGSIFLALLSVLPAVIVKAGVQPSWALFYGGTSLLIMVGVAIDTIQQINSYLLNRHYDGLMKTGTKRKSVA